MPRFHKLDTLLRTRDCRNTLVCGLRPACYIDETQTVEFGEVHVFAGPRFVITVRHSEAPELYEFAVDTAEVTRNLDATSNGGDDPAGRPRERLRLVSSCGSPGEPVRAPPV